MMRPLTLVSLALAWSLMPLLGALPELPLPGAERLAKAKSLPIPATDTHPVEWANPGSLGPTGITARRSMTSLEYKVLAVDAGSPAAGLVLPGDRVVGIDGGVFGPEDYSGEHPSVAKYNRLMEPHVAIGSALAIAAGWRHDARSPPVVTSPPAVGGERAWFSLLPLGGGEESHDGMSRNRFLGSISLLVVSLGLAKSGCVPGSLTWSGRCRAV